MLKILYIYIFLLFNPGFDGQRSVYSSWDVYSSKEFASVMQEINKNYRERNYSMKVSYALYDERNEQTPLDKSSGYFKKYKNNYVSFSQGVYTMQNENLKLVIDSSRKLIILKDKDKYLSFLPNAKTFTSLIDSMSVIRIKIINNEKCFYVDTKPGHTAASYLIKTSADNSIKELNIFYNVPFGTDNDDYPLAPASLSEKEEKKIKPVMKIIFSNLDFRYTPLTDDFRENKYVTYDGKKYSLTKKMNEFQLLDLRVK